MLGYYNPLIELTTKIRIGYVLKFADVGTLLHQDHVSAEDIVRSIIT